MNLPIALAISLIAFGAVAVFAWVLYAFGARSDAHLAAIDEQAEIQALTDREDTR
jgi:hypothetical protein